MDENNIDEINYNISVSDKSDTEIIKECEAELQNVLEWDNLCAGTYLQSGGKRPREESEESYGDGFTEIIRRKPKRLIRSNSTNNQNFTLMEIQTNNIPEEFEVSVTSQQPLLKQMAFAKCLKAENIINVLSIKYKSPYKAIIRFKNKSEAEKLINSSKICELGYRCRMTLESNVSYGVIKGIDMEIEDQEIRNILECSEEIVSVTRLKRLSSEGKWVKCETVRVVFNSTVLPSFIYAYGCRIKVEPYVFPVTQCSGCWRFGHILKYCPMKKTICPKCGQGHNNCDLKEVKCLNCKGPHMPLDKTCPVFLKEKQIRRLMCDHNVTYKRAVNIYLQGQKSPLLRNKENSVIIQNEKSHNTQELNHTVSNTHRSYSSVVAMKNTVHKDSDSGSSSDNEKTCEKSIMKTTLNKKKKVKKDNDYNKVNRNLVVENCENKRQDTDEDQRKCSGGIKSGNFDFKKLCTRIKDIVMSDNEFLNKFILIMKEFYEMLKLFIMSVIPKSSALDFFIGIFNG
jgi:hypothetical protein